MKSVITRLLRRFGALTFTFDGVTSIDTVFFRFVLSITKGKSNSGITGP